MEPATQKFSDYLEYLDEIRRRLYTVALFFLVLFIGGFFLAAKVIGLVIYYFKIPQVTIVTTSPFQFIDLAVNVGLFTALIFCLPFLIYQVYSFLKDALGPREKKFFVVLLPISVILFLIGFGYGFATLFYALELIAGINTGLGVVNLWDINKFLSQIVLTAALLGAIFQFPIVLTFLIRLKVIDRSYLRKNRRYAYAIIFVFVALLPPTDGLSLIVMALPLLLIYEATIIANFFIRHKQSKFKTALQPEYMEELVEEYEHDIKEDFKK